MNKFKEFIKKNILLIVLVAVISGLITLSANSIFGKIENTNNLSSNNEKEILIIKEQLKNISENGTKERKIIIEQLEDISIDIGSLEAIIREHDKDIATIKGKLE